MAAFSVLFNNTHKVTLMHSSPLPLLPVPLPPLHDPQHHPVEQLHPAEKREPGEQSQGTPDVGDDVYGRGRCGHDDLGDGLAADEGADVVYVGGGIGQVGVAG